jgi:hypothetical protein
VREISSAQDFETLFDLINQIGFVGALTTIASTFVGAFFAFKFQELAVRRRKNLEESIALNRATAIVTSHLTAIGNYRRQIALPKLKELEELIALCEEYEMKKREGHAISRINIRPAQLSNRSYPINYLKGQISSGIFTLSSIAGRPLAMATEMERSTEALNSLIEDQNQMLDELWHDRNDENFTDRLLGLVMSDGSTDRRFSHSVEQIARVTLEVLFFGNAIVNDLVDHHIEWRRRNGGSPKSIIRYSATEKLQSELKAVEIKEDWGKYSMVRLYKI